MDCSSLTHTHTHTHAHARTHTHMHTEYCTRQIHCLVSHLSAWHIHTHTCTLFFCVSTRSCTITSTVGAHVAHCGVLRHFLVQHSPLCWSVVALNTPTDEATCLPTAGGWAIVPFEPTLPHSRPVYSGNTQGWDRSKLCEQSQTNCQQIRLFTLQTFPSGTTCPLTCRCDV